jgi:hypothetical protein
MPLELNHRRFLQLGLAAAPDVFVGIVYRTV